MVNTCVLRTGSKEQEIMKSGPQLALAVGFGYLLGRRKRLRTALVLGAAAAVGRLSRDPRQLLTHGTRALGASPELSRVAGLGGPLVEAGKAAARAAVTNRIDSVSERLSQRSEGLRRPQRKAAQEEGPEGRREAPSEEPEEREYEEYEYEEEEREEAPPARERRRLPQRESAARRPQRRPPEEPEDEEPEEEPAEEPPAARATRTRPATGGAPVRRRGR